MEDRFAPIETHDEIEKRGWVHIQTRLERDEARTHSPREEKPNSKSFLWKGTPAAVLSWDLTKFDVVGQEIRKRKNTRNDIKIPIGGGRRTF